jgi:adenosylhomocysteine nucleosidase
MSDAAPPTQDTAHADIGIVCALHLELGAFLERCDRVKKYTGGKFTFRGGKYDSVRIAIVEAGAGFARTRDATQALIDAHTPPWILSVGFSGALRREMKVGDIVMANAIVDTHGHELDIDLRAAGDPQHGLHVGKIVTADHIVRTVAEKEALAAQTGGLAVDLESLAVAQICRDRKFKFMAVRVISDDMSADLPPEVLSVFGSTGSIRAGAVAGALWKRFSSAKDMWRLHQQAAQAAEKLATFLDGVVKQLAPTPAE